MLGVIHLLHGILLSRVCIIGLILCRAKCEKSDHDDVSLPTEIHDPQNSRSSPSYNHVEKHLLGKPEFEIDGKFSDSPPVNSRQRYISKFFHILS